ncbi:MAG TPA: TAXI family TRAP transporter solute-binding subunit [Burkholderiales bacterium]|nr:TAXI family TRAP transporter solute-binding subunit [Burkholderiales bacterium]
MPRIIRDTLISVRDLAVAALPFALLALALLVAAYFLLKPMPPKRVVLATGPEQSAYAEFGKRYAAELKRYGVEVVLLPTRGSLDNLRALRDPKRDVDLGFVQGGSSEVARSVDEDKSGEPIESLGSLFLEPLWVFYREDAARALPGGTLTSIAQLSGWRVNLGARGSGTPGLMRKLLEANGLERERLTPSYLELTPAVVALLDGKLDAMAFASAPESPMVQMLLQTPGVRLLEFPEAEAFARRFPFLNPVTLPQGIADLARNVPAHDVQLIAATTSLVAREGTHPALEQLFVQAAARIHGGAGWISRAGRFPTPQGTEFPLAAEAARFYRTGPPLLQRYLPFWLANLIDRMWVALFTIIAALIPLSRIVPPLYQFRVRRRIFRWYRQLRSVEAQVADASAPRADLIVELDRLDARAARITVPLAYADELYNLRGHIALIRARLSP